MTACPKPARRARKAPKPIQRSKRPAYLRVRGGRGKLRKLADDAMSLYVRCRDGWRCQRCQRQENIQCAHIVPKSGEGQAGRYDEKNAMALCSRCHAYFTSHPYEWRIWVGPDRFDGLYALYRGLVKWDYAEEARRYLIMAAKPGSRVPEDRLGELQRQAVRLELWQ